MKLEFGAYVKVYEDNSPTNTIKTRTIGAIALNPTGNQQGDYHFMSLVTGAKNSRHQWVEMPITFEVIARVEVIATQQNQPPIRGGTLLFEWRPNIPVADEHENPGDDDPDDPMEPQGDPHRGEEQGADEIAVDNGNDGSDGSDDDTPVDDEDNHEPEAAKAEHDDNVVSVESIAEAEEENYEQEELDEEEVFEPDEGFEPDKKMRYPRTRAKIMRPPWRKRQKGPKRINQGAITPLII